MRYKGDEEQRQRNFFTTFSSAIGDNHVLPAEDGWLQSLAVTAAVTGLDKLLRHVLL
jgi:hypothetical protein